MASKPVWDIPTRLFHWLLVSLVALLWVSGEFGGLDISGTLPGLGQFYYSNMDIHALAGQGVFVLIIFRLFWGIWGSTTSRFSHFAYRPKAIQNEAKLLLKGQIPETTGHNPLGGLMVIVLIAVLLAQSLSGLFASDDLFYEAPLAGLVSSDNSKTITGWHHDLFGVLQALIILHIAAVFYYLIRGKNLIKAMITGRNPAVDNQKLSIKPLWLGAVSLILATTVLVLLRSVT